MQTFAYPDLVVVATLSILEGLLSADNALVLALLVRHLPARKQSQTLSLGLLMAFLLRTVGIALAGYIIRFWWLCGIGALYLIGLSVKHLRNPGANDHPPDESASKRDLHIRNTVLLIGFTDLFFAVDSILVAVALVDIARHPDKAWMVYLGGFLGILLLRATAGVFIHIIQKYPALDRTAYRLVFWAGVKLGCTSLHLFDERFPEMNARVFWSVFLLIILMGVFSNAGFRRASAGRRRNQQTEGALPPLAGYRQEDP